MPPYGEPDWVNQGDKPTTAPATVSAPASASGQNGVEVQGETHARLSLVLLSLINIGLSVAMVALGVLTLIDVASSFSTDLSKTFLAAYMCVFGMLLFLYELMWWTPIAALNKTFRRNFGFMYGLKGKGFYLVFCAFLTLGLVQGTSSSLKGLDWGTGIGWLAMGFVHLFVGFTWPDANDAYRPPSAGLVESGGPENVV